MWIPECYLQLSLFKLSKKWKKWKNSNSLSRIYFVSWVSNYFGYQYILKQKINFHPTFSFIFLSKYYIFVSSWNSLGQKWLYYLISLFYDMKPIFFIFISTPLSREMPLSSTYIYNYVYKSSLMAIFNFIKSFLY